jgi:hypothetical protein
MKIGTLPFLTNMEHYERCYLQDEDQPCICDQIAEEKYNAYMEAQIQEYE